MVGFILRRSFARTALLTAAAVVALFSSPDLAHSGYITYDLVDYQPAELGGWTVTGWIETNGTLGSLTKDEIVAWYWSATPGTDTADTVYASSSDTGLFFEVQGLYATATSLSIPLGDDNVGDLLKIGTVGNGAFLLWENNDSTDITYQGHMNLGEQFAWTTTTEQPIATLEPGSGGAVPEPSSIMIWSGLASVAVFCRHLRRMRSMLTG